MDFKVLKQGLCVILTLLLFFTILPIQAARAAEADKLQLSLKVGSTSATVNGKKVTIERPYMENGTVMVPLGVFKKTFGSTVSLEGNDVVKVTYGSHTGLMTIGSTSAWKDETKVKLSSAPRMVSGVLMVPLRFVASVLGATLSQGNGGELIITLVPADNEGDMPVDTGIDSDVGKTQIGNSYFQWTLNYPSGLIAGNSGGDESVATFSSADDLYYLEIHASDQAVSVDADGLLEQLVREVEEGGELILDRESFPKASVPYARLVSKDSSGALWESRLIYAEGRLYEIYLTDEKATHYKDLAKYAGLLSSFRPSFDIKDNKIRDLSTVKNGLSEAYNEDFGISLKVPAAWSKDDQHFYYESKQGSHLTVAVSSAPAGSTLESWAEDLKAKTQENFVADAYVFKDSMKSEISGVPAQISETQLNFGIGWTTEYQAIVLKDGYRYYFEYVTPAGQEDDKAKFKAIITSIDIDFDHMKENFGRLASDDYKTLKNKTITKVSKRYGYAIDIPRLWIPNQDVFETQSVEYRFIGGRFQINSKPEGTVDYTVNVLKDSYQNKNSDPKGPRIESIVESTFAGVPATILTVHQIKNGVPVRSKQVVFGKNEVVYTITVTLNDANATAEQQALLDKTLQSFRFTGNE
ncbi:stalk domain-containing protein [Paenibacillus sp. G2S3]|uniref:stalk domain-containing protein n=1 Tax=Paenibacillus sp. G2S3 TaxID=3047872 RepID=UPI0024C1FAB0|nr:stalk domain-containing protein [Paenibacillus sp. G2S3]WHY19030.1 stalk domain-containing protein [Paenibacillus sp. G2S3]